MTPAQIALARRLVALKGWRWPEHVAGTTLLLPGWKRIMGEWMPIICEFDGDLPNLSSPLVVGWVLFLLREAADDPLLHAGPCLDAAGDVYEWRVWPADIFRWWSGPTEIEALINALAALEEA